MSELTGLLGLAKKAGRLEAGDEPVTEACQARKARLVLLAADAADNTGRKAQRLGEIGNVPVVRLAETKADLGGALGRSSCALMALTDIGFADSLVKKLQSACPGQYDALAQTLSEKAEKAAKRQKEMRQHEKNLQKGGKKPWAAPPSEAARDKRRKK